jgi:hypothetical protein
MFLTKKFRECTICDQVFHPVLQEWMTKEKFADLFDVSPLDLAYEQDVCEFHSDLMNSDMEFDSDYVDEVDRKGDGHAGSC